MIEREENRAESAQAKPKTPSSEPFALKGDRPGRSGTSSTCKDPTLSALSPSSPSASHPLYGRLPEPARTSPHDRAAFQPGPSRSLIIQTGHPSETQMAKEEQCSSNTAWHEKGGSHSSVVSPVSPKLESPRDLEKSSLGQQSLCPEPSHFASAQYTSTTDMDGDDIAEDDDPSTHAMKILIFLSTLAPALSLATCLYTLIATLLILLLSPFCLCTTSNRIQRNFQRFLAPPLSLQLKFIYSDFDDEGTSRNSKSILLVIINMLAPVYAIGICMAAWVAAGFWFFAAILGDPNIKDETERGKDDDGRTAVMTVRFWWERWLIRGLR